MRDAEVKVSGLKENKQIFARVQNFIERGDRGLYEEIGDIAVDLIQERTKSGKDVNDQSFKSYSKQYAKKKGTNFVDLIVSEKMLGAIRRQPFKNKVRIYMLKRKRKGIKISNYDLARIHNFGARTGKRHTAKIPKREFFGISKRDISKLRNRFTVLFYHRLDKITFS